MLDILSKLTVIAVLLQAALGALVRSFASALAATRLHAASAVPSTRIELTFASVRFFCPHVNLIYQQSAGGQEKKKKKRKESKEKATKLNQKDNVFLSRFFFYWLEQSPYLAVASYSQKSVSVVLHQLGQFSCIFSLLLFLFHNNILFELLIIFFFFRALTERAC